MNYSVTEDESHGTRSMYKGSILLGQICMHACTPYEGPILYVDAIDAQTEYMYKLGTACIASIPFDNSQSVHA